MSLSKCTERRGDGRHIAELGYVFRVPGWTMEPSSINLGCNLVLADRIPG